MNKLNTFEERRNAPQGIVVHKKVRKDGSVVVNKFDRYSIYRGEKKAMLFRYLENQAKKVDGFVKKVVICQLFMNEK